MLLPFPPDPHQGGSEDHTGEGAGKKRRHQDRNVHTFLRAFTVSHSGMALFLKRTILVGILAASMAGCTSPLSPVESRELQEAEARWTARPFEAYSFEMRVGCFCAPALNEWSRVEVVNGTVSRVITIASGNDVSPGEKHYFPTVERLFADIRQASGENWVQDIEVEFDAALGYPTTIRFEPKRGILDAGSSYELRNAAALP